MGVDTCRANLMRADDVRQVLGASAAEVQEEMRGLADLYASLDLEALYSDPLCAVCGPPPMHTVPRSKHAILCTPPSICSIPLCHLISPRL